MGNGLKGWFDVFKAGTHTDSKGHTWTYTAADLDKMAASFKSGDSRVPLVIGHEHADTAPAYGWVDAVRRRGDTLQVRARDVVPEFEDAVRKKQYRNISIQHDLTPDRTLRHVAFLGAVPPAVKGLEDVNFSEDGEDLVSVNFSEESLARQATWRNETAYSLLRNMKNYLIEKEGADKADEILPEWQLEELSRPIEADKPDETDNMNPAYSGRKEETVENGTKEKTPHELELEQQVEKLTAQFAQRDQADRRRELKAYADKLVQDGKLLPAQVDGFVGFAETLDAAEKTVSFSEGSEKVSPAEYLKKFMDAIPAGATGKHDGAASYAQGEPKTNMSLEDDGREALDKKIRAYATEHKISYSDALKEVINVVE